MNVTLATEMFKSSVRVRPYLVAEVEHGKPLKPLGGGRARLPNGCRNASLVVPHKPSECMDVLGRTVNCWFMVCAIAFELEWVFPSKAIEIFGGDSTICCPEEASKVWDWRRGRRTPAGTTTGLALHGECPGPAA